MDGSLEIEGQELGDKVLLGAYIEFYDPSEDLIVEGTAVLNAYITDLDNLREWVEAFTYLLDEDDWDDDWDDD